MAAMFSFHDFDLRSRGIADVVEVWTSHDPGAESIRDAAELIAASTDLVNAADCIRNSGRLNGNRER